MIKHPDDQQNLISKVKGIYIIANGKRLGESEKVKDCYWAAYELEDKYYISLNDNPENVYLLNKKSINYYIN